MSSANIDDLRGAVLYLRRNGCFEFSGAISDAISELDALRAQNAALISAAQKQDKREHEMMMERRALAKQVQKRTRNDLGERAYCAGCGAMVHMIDDWRVKLTHKESCPVALAERVLAEPVANPRAISGDKAPYLARDGANG